MGHYIIAPDGSTFDARIIAAIRWSKFRPGEYGGKARVTIDTYREPLMFGGGRGPFREQIHYVEMESDEAAEKACRAMVLGWLELISEKHEPVP